MRLTWFTCMILTLRLVMEEARSLALHSLVGSGAGRLGLSVYSEDALLAGLRILTWT
jgi:hypothetical protein